MSHDRAETSCNTDVAATTDKQMTERNAKGAPASAAKPTVRPWTSKFLLPSIRFRAPKRA
jgi:hypothetical protein